MNTTANTYYFQHPSLLESYLFTTLQRRKLIAYCKSMLHISTKKKGDKLIPDCRRGIWENNMLVLFKSGITDVIAWESTWSCSLNCAQSCIKAHKKFCSLLFTKEMWPQSATRKKHWRQFQKRNKIDWFHERWKRGKHYRDSEEEGRKEYQSRIASSGSISSSLETPPYHPQLSNSRPLNCIRTTNLSAKKERKCTQQYQKTHKYGKAVAAAIACAKASSAVWGNPKWNMWGKKKKKKREKPKFQNYRIKSFITAAAIVFLFSLLFFFQKI